MEIDRPSPLPATTRQVLLRDATADQPWSQAFELQEIARPQPNDGQILVENLIVDVAPYQRLVMAGRYPGEPGHGPGMPMLAETVGRVVESRHRAFATGDLVAGRSLWQEHLVLDGERLSYGESHRHRIEKLPAGEARLSAYLGVFGINGFTAYAGLVFLGCPTPGDTVVVSAAGGSVGSLAGQIARLAACRVVGIASTPEKARRVQEAYGFDACVAYRRADWLDALADACPDGIDVYFDNVGGEMLKSITGRMNPFGRIVLCGFASEYGQDRGAFGLSSLDLLPRGLTVRGHVVWHHMHRRAEMHRKLDRWLTAGQLAAPEDIEHGLERAPGLLERVMRGETFGKALVYLSDPSNPQP